MNNALPWALDEREKVLIGVNFSTKSRRPDDWVIERGGGTRVSASEQVREHEGEHDREHDGEHDPQQISEQVKRLILALDVQTKNREELMILLNRSGRRNFMEKYTNPAIALGVIAMTLPDKPQSKEQRYYLTDRGLAMLDELKKG